jgi:hypothetical protein
MRGVAWQHGRVSTQETVYQCSSCGVERIGPGIGDFAGERLPCANDRCGSVNIDTKMTISAQVASRDLLKAKLKEESLGSRKGRKVDVTNGAEYYRLGQRWHRVERRIDYANDWYDEVITDEATGQVVREVHQSLKEHQGRGSAKRPPATP